MVKAILDGRKTVTRRICKDANDRTVPLNEFIDNEKRTYAIQYYSDKEHTQPTCLCEISMPICKGDILYVRETWCKNGDTYLYKAGCLHLQGNMWIKWHPSIHMPKSAARIFLRVTDVRVERLQDITDKEAKKEGVIAETNNSGLMHKLLFLRLWDTTVDMENHYMDHSWGSNPWVWVIEFERISKEEAYEK